MHIAIISGSTRINRQSHRVALALQRYLQADLSHSAEVLDLAAYAFPIMEEVLQRLPSPPSALHDFADRVRAADALLIVSPEYNGSYTAALKNAMDYLVESEFAQKAIGTVSVTTGPLGGMRAAMNMQELILGVAAFPIPQMLLVGQVHQKFDEQGLLIDAAFEPKIRTFLDRFLWLAEAVVAKKGALVG